MFTPEQLAILEKVKRPANKVIIDDVQNEIDVTANPFGSWFGHIGVMRPDEQWPYWHNTPMMPLCQINIAELPVRPDIFSNVALISVWIGECKYQESGALNSVGWQMRYYSSLDELISVKDSLNKQMHNKWQGNLTNLLKHIKKPKLAPIKWQLVDDYPDDEYVKTLLSHEEIRLYEELSTSGEFYSYWIDESKVGGWPSIMEGQPVFKSRPEVEFVFQISSYPNLDWKWHCDPERGFGYFGYSKIDKSKWFFDQICTY